MDFSVNCNVTLNLHNTNDIIIIKNIIKES